MFRLLTLLIIPLLIGCEDSPTIEPIDRSWSSGVVTVEPRENNGAWEVNARGSWPDASKGLWIRYSCSLVQTGGPNLWFQSDRGSELARIQGNQLGSANYSESLKRLKYPDQPYRVAFDYEIWNGKPGSGQLLTKQSVYSEPMTSKVD